ncbi:MAG: plasmid partitioning protein RepB, partial [Hyphomicrobiaceae bacterium]
PQIGRRRWMELAEKLAGAQVELKRVLKSLSADNSSDQRFQDAFDALTPSLPIKEMTKTKPWEPEDGSVSVTVRATSKKAVVTYESKDGPSLATYIAHRLDDLYEAFRKSEKTSTGV